MSYVVCVLIGFFQEDEGVSKVLISFFNSRCWSMWNMMSVVDYG